MSLEAISWKGLEKAALLKADLALANLRKAYNQTKSRKGRSPAKREENCTQGRGRARIPEKDGEGMKS